MSTTFATYSVAGMSCQHCVDSVTAEISKLGGVDQVDVDLAGGTVAVASNQPLELDQVRSALDEAGFDLVETPGAETAS